MSSTSTFPGIIGHARAIGTLRQAAIADRLHHAYLFVGPDGIGKRQVAIALAQVINCVGPSAAAATPCGECTHCRRIVEGQHPDVVMIAPDRSKARPVIKIDAVRGLLRQVHYKPYEASRRVVLIDDAEALTEEAANALLKTLEEPSGETLFMLISARPQRLLATIRSRCQRVNFAPLSRAQVCDFLASRAMPSERAALVAAYSDGSFGAAVSLGEEGVLESRRELIKAVVGLRRSDTLRVFSLANEQSRVAADELYARLEALKTFYRDVVLLRSGADPARLINVDLREAIVRQSRELTVEVAIGHIERIDEVQRLRRAYVDALMLLEDLFFALAS